MSIEPDSSKRLEIHKTWANTITGITVLTFVAFVLYLFFGGK